nr:hypothetical protein [Streptococcus oralis]
AYLSGALALSLLSPLLLRIKWPVYIQSCITLAFLLRDFLLNCSMYTDAFAIQNKIAMKNVATATISKNAKLP